MRYAGNARERFVEIGTAAVGVGPTDNTTPPLITLSPRTARGLPTAGLALVLVGYPPPNGFNYSPAVAAVDGFTLYLFRLLPTIGGWSRLQSFAGVQFGDQLVLPDISGGMGLYVGIGNVGTPGNLLVGLAELD
jgi:hypothetical protein